MDQNHVNVKDLVLYSGMSRCNTDISSCGQNVVGASMFPSTEGTGGDIRVPTNGIHMSEVCRLQRTVPGSVWAPALA